MLQFVTGNGSHIELTLQLTICKALLNVSVTPQSGNRALAVCIVGNYYLNENWNTFNKAVISQNCLYNDNPY